MKIKSFKDLIVWQKSMDLITNVYKISNGLPKQENFGLASQVQRAAVSIASNIAEGSKRSSRADFKHFCTIAIGSAAELETQLIVIGQIYPFIPLQNTIEEINEIQKMLSSLINRLGSVSQTKNYQL